MAVLFARIGRVAAMSLAAAILALHTLAGEAAESSVLSVRIDQARIARLPDRVATLVVGNPLIADVSLQQGGFMVITGKGYGVTNLIALDRSGTVLSEQSIEVQGPSDGVVLVYRGMQRESYSCTPRCERRITLGDSPEFFDSTITQAGNRTARALGAALPTGPVAAGPTGAPPAPR